MVEEATPDALAAGDLDVCLFSVGTAASQRARPACRAAAAPSASTSRPRSASQDGVPLVVPEVNGARALEHDGHRREPELLHDPADDARSSRCTMRRASRRVRVATYQSASGAGAEADGAAARRAVRPSTTSSMDWDYDGVEFDEEAKLRDGDPQDPRASASCRSARRCVRVPVLVGHAEAVWVETEEPLSPEDATALLAAAPGIGARRRRPDARAGRRPGRRARRPGPPRPAAENGLALFVVGDNLRKGAALNAIQIAELVLAEASLAA